MKKAIVIAIAALLLLCMIGQAVAPYVTYSSCRTVKLCRNIEGELVCRARRLCYLGRVYISAGTTTGLNITLA